MDVFVIQFANVLDGGTKCERTSSPWSLYRTRGTLIRAVSRHNSAVDYTKKIRLRDDNVEWGVNYAIMNSSSILFTRMNIIRCDETTVERHMVRHAGAGNSRQHSVGDRLVATSSLQQELVSRLLRRVSHQ